MAAVNMAEAATSADEFSDDFIDQLPSKDEAFMNHAQEARHKQQTPQPDGETQVFRPRAYQLEMFEESMKRNVIIAVWRSVTLLVDGDLISCRWILEAGKHICIAITRLGECTASVPVQISDIEAFSSILAFHCLLDHMLTYFRRAVLRIQAELYRCASEKVWNISHYLFRFNTSADRMVPCSNCRTMPATI